MKFRARRGWPFTCSFTCFVCEIFTSRFTLSLVYIKLQIILLVALATFQTLSSPMEGGGTLVTPCRYGTSHCRTFYKWGSAD